MLRLVRLSPSPRASSIGIVRAGVLSLKLKESVNLKLKPGSLGSQSQCKMSTDASAKSEERMEKQEEEEEEEVVVQYVVLRRDLIETWPLGSVVTQGCHASVAAIWEHKDDASTLRYCAPPALDSMHKVTLEVKGETQMVNLSEKLKSNGILHKLWIEQPENIPTCLATKPYPKTIVSPFFKKLKLCK